MEIRIRPASASVGTSIEFTGDGVTAPGRLGRDSGRRHVEQLFEGEGRPVEGPRDYRLHKEFQGRDRKVLVQFGADDTVECVHVRGAEPTVVLTTEEGRVPYVRMLGVTRRSLGEFWPGRRFVDGPDFMWCPELGVYVHFGADPYGGSDAGDRSVSVSVYVTNPPGFEWPQGGSDPVTATKEILLRDAFRRGSFPSAVEEDVARWESTAADLARRCESVEALSANNVRHAWYSLVLPVRERYGSKYDPHVLAAERALLEYADYLRPEESFVEELLERKRLGKFVTPPGGAKRPTPVTASTRERPTVPASPVSVSPVSVTPVPASIETVSTDDGTPGHRSTPTEPDNDAGTSGHAAHLTTPRASRVVGAGTDHSVHAHAEPPGTKVSVTGERDIRERSTGDSGADERSNERSSERRSEGGTDRRSADYGTDGNGTGSGKSIGKASRAEGPSGSPRPEVAPTRRASGPVGAAETSSGVPDDTRRGTPEERHAPSSGRHVTPNDEENGATSYSSDGYGRSVGDPVDGDRDHHDPGPSTFRDGDVPDVDGADTPDVATPRGVRTGRRTPPPAGDVATWMRDLGMPEEQVRRRMRTADRATTEGPVVTDPVPDAPP